LFYYYLRFSENSNESSAIKLALDV